MPKSKLFKPACCPCKCTVFSSVQHLNTERLYCSIWLISWTLLFIHLSIFYECFKSMESDNGDLLDNKTLFEPCNISGIISFEELQRMNNTKKELINIKISLLKLENFYPKHATQIQPFFDSIFSNISQIQKVLKSQKEMRQICYYRNLQSFAKFTIIRATQLICLPLICIFFTWYLTMFIILTHKFQSKFVEFSYKKLFQLIRKTFFITLFVLFLISDSLCIVVILTLLKDFDDYVK
uniref:Uncharacterized protein n=1 Tax=Panagrolaimus superbus TaxID=310955 RepID=A0A914YSS1_9BILA